MIEKEFPLQEIAVRNKNISELIKWLYIGLMLISKLFFIFLIFI